MGHKKIKKMPKFLTILIACVIKVWFWTLRKRVIDDYQMVDYLDSDGDPKTVSIIWHNRLMFFPLMMRKKERRQAAGVISASRDGEYLQDLVAQFGVAAIRGSSSRNALQALRACFEEENLKRHISFTPDGPRGPCYKMSNGPIYVANKLKRKVIPLAINASSFWELKSWDRFQVPKPFSTLTLVYGKCIDIPENLEETDFERYRTILKQALDEITVDKKKK